MNGCYGSPAGGVRGRTEPVLGDLRQPDEPQRSTPVESDLPPPPPQLVDPGQVSVRMPSRKRVHLRVMWWCLLLLPLVGAGLWLGRGYLQAMLPRTGVDDLLHRARMALGAGRLDGKNGTSARELYEAVHVLRPDSDRALHGLAAVGHAGLARARAALEKGQLDRAGQALAVAIKLLGNSGETRVLGQALARARDASGRLATLLTQARQALRSGRLDGQNGAGTLYRRVLAGQPHNALARRGLEQVGNIVRAQAQQALAQSDQSRARAQIDRLAALLPDDPGLSSLRAGLMQLQRRQQVIAAVATYIEQGRKALRAGHMDGSGRDTALTCFKAALALDPGNTQARLGLGRVAAALLVQASAALDAGDEAQAQQLLDRAAVLAPDSPGLQMVRLRLHPQPAGTATSTP